jgi:Zn-dependent oligopeptidase
MSHCEVQKTRKDLYIAFNNRANPSNVKTLLNMVFNRDNLATGLGFKSYAHLDISSEMAKSPGIFSRDIFS